MKTLALSKSTLLFIATLALAAPASGSQMGPWPSTTTWMWETNPISPVCGTVQVVAPDSLQMSGFTSGNKSTWLPYFSVDSGYSERMCIAQFVFPSELTSHGVDTVHAKVYDPATSGKSGWAVILKDSTGRILDFGIRGYFASQQIKPRQYDGSTWTIPSFFYTRTRTGNNYYTMDFARQADGTIKYALYAYENGDTWYNSYATTVTYADIKEIYLNVMTPDTTGGVNYKWTEFGVSLNYNLAVALQSPDVVVSWPTNQSPGVLQQSATLPTGWGDVVTPAPVVSGYMWTVTLPQDPAGQFFRLRPQ